MLHRRYSGVGIFFFMMFFSSASLAEEVALGRLVRAEGAIFFEGKSIEQGYEFKKEGWVETGKDGKAKLELLPSGSIVQLMSNGKLKLSPPKKDEETVELREGTLRTKIPSKKKEKIQFRVKTRAAVMGVRGTDFMAVRNGLLNESEIIVFEGEVDFQSVAHENDHQLITKNHWGGIGGRFGSKIGEVLKLPPAIIGHFSKATALLD